MSEGRPAWLDDELATPAVANVVAFLAGRDLTVGVAESLTGGLVTAELIRPPGASAVVLGGIVAYATSLKHDILGVDAALLAERGPVDPVVAQQMASGVRRAVAVDGAPARIGVSTTGVAGPDAQGGQPPGTVYIGIATADEVASYRLALDGGRDRIRTGTVSAVLRMIAAHVGL